MAYAKLFSHITESSLWSASKEARLLFVTLLAKADRVGFFETSIPGLARVANLSLVETEQALAELMAPDPYSKSKAYEGRRVEVVDRGFLVINYQEYRNRRDEEARREYMANLMADRRAKDKEKREGKPTKTTGRVVKSESKSVSKSYQRKPPLAQAEAEAEADVLTPSSSSSVHRRTRKAATTTATIPKGDALKALEKKLEASAKFIKPPPAPVVKINQARVSAIDRDRVRAALGGTDPMPLLVACAVTVKNMEGEWRRECAGLRLVDILIVLDWCVVERKDPVRLPRGFMAARVEFKQQPKAFRERYALDLAEHYGFGS